MKFTEFSPDPQDVFKSVFSSTLKHGDLVIFRNPTYPDSVDVKRLIGKHRDTVTPVKNTLKADTEPVPVYIKKGYMFLEGDNMYQNQRQHDSNRFGIVPEGLTIGLVLGRIDAPFLIPSFLALGIPHMKDLFLQTIPRAIPKKRVQLHEWIKHIEDDLEDLKHEDMLEPKASKRESKESMFSSFFGLKTANLDKKSYTEK